MGGVSTWSIRLGRTLRDRGDLECDLHTLFIATSPPAVGRTPPGVDLRDPSQHLLVIDPGADTHEILSLVRETMESFQPDVILPNYSDITWAAATQLRPRGVRTIAIAHTDDSYYRSQIRMYERWDVGVAVSTSCLTWMRELAGDRRIEQITYGVPVAAQPRRSAFAAGRRDAMRLAYIGRMVEAQKRVSRLPQLAACLDELGVPFELDLVGDGPSLEDLRRRLEWLGPQARFHGALPHSVVGNILSEVDVSVLVSDSEGASISMLEAMGAGVVPCVTEVSSGVGDWLRDGENGLLAPVGDIDAMAHKLATLAREPQNLDLMGGCAWRTVRDRLTLERTAERYADVFRLAMRSDPHDESPTDLGFRLRDLWRWNKGVSATPHEATAMARQGLGEAGFRCISEGRPGPDTDAVIVDLTGELQDVPSDGDIDRWRSQGLAVVQLPNFKPAPEFSAARAAIREALDTGLARIVIYGCGAQTRSLAPFIADGVITGFVDDDPAGPVFMGLPVARPDEMFTHLDPDLVLLSSPRNQAAMWCRCAMVRAAHRRDLRVAPLFCSMQELSRTEETWLGAASALEGRESVTVLGPWADASPLLEFISLLRGDAIRVRRIRALDEYTGDDPVLLTGGGLELEAGTLRAAGCTVISLGASEPETALT